jgi:hypothetical protein
VLNALCKAVLLPLVDYFIPWCMLYLRVLLQESVCRQHVTVLGMGACRLDRLTMTYCDAVVCLLYVDALHLHVKRFNGAVRVYIRWTWVI